MQQSLNIFFPDPVFDAGMFANIRAGTIISTSAKVAVKTGHLPSSKKGLLNELSILSRLQEHSNIVKLHGVVTTGSDRFLIVLEMCEFRSLKSFVMNSTLHNERADVRYDEFVVLYSL